MRRQELEQAVGQLVGDDHIAGPPVADVEAVEHLDAELLSLLALGEPAGSPADAEHLAACGECAGTLAALERTVRAATVDPAEVELATPGPHNWAAIHQALGLSPDQAQDPLSRRPSAGSATTAVVGGLGSATSAVVGGLGSATSAVGSAGRSTAKRPAPLGPPARGGRTGPPRTGAVARPWVAPAAAAAGIVVGAVAVWAAYSLLGRGPEAEPSPTQTAPQAVLLAEAPLEPLKPYTASGTAVVEQLPNGTRQLVVRLANGQVSGFREVWVIAPDLSKLISLGVLDGDPGVFALPEGLNLAEYPIVDVSNEPFDGNLGHSSDSLARGELVAED
nr:anti-sigma factor [Arthrobacter sp. ISL-72]